MRLRTLDSAYSVSSAPAPGPVGPAFALGPVGSAEGVTAGETGKIVRGGLIEPWRHGAAFRVILKMADEPVEPAGREFDVGVKDEKIIACGAGESAVMPLAEAEVRRMRDDAHAVGKRPEALEGVVVAGIVEDDHFKRELRRGEQVLQTGGDDRTRAVGHDAGGDPGRRRHTGVRYCLFISSRRAMILLEGEALHS